MHRGLGRAITTLVLQALLASGGQTLIGPTEGLIQPAVLLDHGTFIGARDLNTSTNKFLGIPFAKPP